MASSERKETSQKKKGSVCGNSRSRGALGFRSKRTKEGQCVGSAGRDAEPESAESAFFLAVREAACTSSLPFWAVGEAACTSIDSDEEVILP